jgi:hypothetical protein
VLLGTEGATSLSSVSTLCNTALGAGVLGLPYAFARAGGRNAPCGAAAEPPAFSNPPRYIPCTYLGLHACTHRNIKEKPLPPTRDKPAASTP